MKNLLQTEEEKNRMLKLYLEGKLPAGELDDFLEFMGSEEGERMLDEKMGEEAFTSNVPLPGNQSSRIYSNINSRISKRKMALNPVFRIAASLLIFIGTGWGIYQSGWVRNQLDYTTVQAPESGQETVVLPDGTRVRLNAGSGLRYSEKMNHQETRRVRLTGEAFFEVAKNPDKPFIIDANDAQVRVLGTVFNVKSVPRRKTVVVAVEEGRVAFKGKGQENGVILTANEVGVMDENRHAVKVAQPARNYFAWFDHYLEFDHVPLAQVVSQLENIFDTDIGIEGDDLENKNFTAYLKAVSLDEVIGQLALSLNVRVRKSGGRYFLTQ